MSFIGTGSLIKSQQANREHKGNFPAETGMS